METESQMDAPYNSYYKDVNNVLNDFEGTWLYTNGNTSLKIILTKNIQYFNGKFYEDIIVGGYQYIENGVEKINTLSDANIPNIGRDASIKGNNIYDNCSIIPADDCIDGEKRLDLSIEDTITKEHFGDLILHKRTVNGQEALKAMIDIGYVGRNYHDVPTPLPTMPSQMRNIILIKQ
ncbi:hypothetical protein N8009_02380 [Flavobacteriaceae bacterium]|nr:hypothetical protein [Flavobacteriaceae bacterium]